MRPQLRRRLTAILLLACAMAVAACSGGDEKQDAESLLDKGFSSSIKSADLSVEAELRIKGIKSLEKPIRIEAGGPFRTNKGKLPSADLELKLGAGGGGQTVQTGFLSTGDRAFVKFEDVYYEQPKSEVKRANDSIRKNQGKRSSLGSLGLDPRKWLLEAKDEGEEKVAGVNTRHVSGKLDVTRLVQDLNTFLRKSSSAIGGATGQDAPKPLSAADIKKVTDVVKDPTFHVYVGEEDDTIRRVSGKLEVAVPEKDRGSVGGIQGGSLEFTVEFKNVNGDQQIEAPKNARPLSALTQSLGSGALGGALGGAGLTGGDAGAGGGAGGAATSPGAGSPEAEDFREYAECLDEARPEDTEALQRCSDLLRR